MRRNCDGFQPPLVFDAVFIQFGDDRGQRDTPLRADVLQRDAQLQDAAKRLHGKRASVKFYGILAAVKRDLNGGWTGFGHDDSAAVNGDLR